jgi:hypothetical protein
MYFSVKLSASIIAEKEMRNAFSLPCFSFAEAKMILERPRLCKCVF